MKIALRKLKHMERGLFVSIAITIICSAGVAAFLTFYFSAYQNSHVEQEVFDLSQGMQFETPQTEPTSMDNLIGEQRLKGGETLTLHRTLDVDLPEAAVLIRTNHQSVDVYVDGVPVYADSHLAPGENPGLAQHIVALPEGYLGKTLTVELTSPYPYYADKASPIIMGTVSSLESYVYSESLRPLIMMVVCSVVWVPIVVIGFLRGRREGFHRERLAVGIYAVIWALFFVSSEYDVFPFFTPVQRSVFSLSMYFLIPVPLSFYFYFSFYRWKKWMLPAVVFHCVFSAAALALQFSGIVDLPRLVFLSDIVMVGILYSIVLAFFEARDKNRNMRLALPFLFIAYGLMLFCFYGFYAMRGASSYDYRDFYFLLILSILIYSIWHFFRDIYRQAKENEMLSVKERLMSDNYENFRTHLQETARLRHDMKNHFAAIGAYLKSGRTAEAQDYLVSYAGQSAAVTEALYSEHFLINAVVGSLYRKGRECGIKVEAKVDAGPLHIEDPDIYSLLSNLTDNALEACRAMPEGQARYISLTITRREPYLNIQCVNSRAGEIISTDGQIQTTKSGDGHGYGLWIIRRIVDDYEGMMNVDHDKTTFTVTLALKDR